jgi:hypothetical protein
LNPARATPEKVKTHDFECQSTELVIQISELLGSCFSPIIDAIPQPVPSNLIKRQAKSNYKYRLNTEIQLAQYWYAPETKENAVLPCLGALDRSPGLKN